jgi:chromosome partitioning protein
MKSILIANPKGGCGKTTIANNLAAAFAPNGLNAVIADVDPQASSLQWLDRRPGDLPEIGGLDWSKGVNKVKKSVERLVIDAPAGISAKEFQTLLKMADYIIMPVIPSAFDQIAAMAFLSKIETLKPIRKNRKQVVIVANRMRPRSRAGRLLNDFLENFNHVPVASLRESVFYVEAAESGMSVFDRKDKIAQSLQMDWVDLLTLLETS